MTFGDPRKFNPGGPVHHPRRLDEITCKEGVEVERRCCRCIVDISADPKLVAAVLGLVGAIRALDATLNRTAEMSAQPSGQPGPAKGLITHVRPSAEHRDRNARGSFTTIRADHFGFTPPWQEEQL